MRNLILLVFVVAGSAARAQEPATAQDKALAATALVRPVERGSTKHGAAVLVKRDVCEAWLLTPAEFVGRATKVGVVFWPGTPSEKEVKGDVVGASGGLGVIRVTGEADLPEPVDLTADLKPKEGAKASIAGFQITMPEKPHSGKPRFMPATVRVVQRQGSSGNTVTAYDLEGLFADGDHGAVVLDGAGNCLGLCRVGASFTTVHLVRNAAIQLWAAGNWGELRYVSRSASATKAKLEFTVTLFSVFGPPKAATLALIRKDRIKPHKEGDKSPGENEKTFPEARESTFTISGMTGKVTVEVDRAKKDESHASFFFQIKVTGANGKSKWCPVGSAEIVFEAGTPTTAGSSTDVYIVPYEPPVPPAPGMTPLVTSAKFEVKEVLKRSCSLEDVYLSPEGDSLVALDLSEGKILRIQASDLTVQAEVEAPSRVAGLAVTPDWKSVWVVSQVPLIKKDGKVEWAGQAVRYSWPDLNPGFPVAMPYAPCEVAANNDGFLAYRFPGDQVALFDGVKGADAGRILSGTGRGPVLHPSGRVVYFSETVPGKTRAIPMGAVTPGAEKSWAADGSRGDPRCQTGISPDGRWLLQPWGQVLGIEASSGESDFLRKFAIDPCVSFAVGKGCNTFFACTEDGLLREYEFGQFVMKRQIPIGKVLRWMSIDPAKKRLYGVAVDWEKSGKGGRGRFAGDLIAITLEKK